MDYMTLKEASQKWNVTPRQINYLCAAGRIPGAVKMATICLSLKMQRSQQTGGEKKTNLSEVSVTFGCYTEIEGV